jgi:hypothetical protein
LEARTPTRTGRKTRFWLLAKALPGEIGYPQGFIERFSSCFLHLVLLSQAFLAQNGSLFSRATQHTGLILPNVGQGFAVQ